MKKNSVHLPYTRRDDVKSESCLKRNRKTFEAQCGYLQAAVCILVLVG